MIIKSELFVSVLKQTSNGIKLLDAEGNYVRTLSQAEAAAVMATGNYMAGGRPSRVRYLRALSKDAAVPVEMRAAESDPSFWDQRHLWTWTAADFGKRHGIRALDGLPA